MAIKVNIHDIRDNKSAQFQDIFNINARDLDLPAMDGVEWQRFTLDFQLTNADNLYVLQGKLTGPVGLVCSRCLKPVNYQLDVDVLEEFSSRPAVDDDVHRFQGEEIDLTQVLREIVLLALPVKPLCSPDCRGLCPHCGIDKNVESCECNPKSVDPRLAVLEKLIRK